MDEQKKTAITSMIRSAYGASILPVEEASPSTSLELAAISDVPIIPKKGKKGMEVFKKTGSFQDFLGYYNNSLCRYNVQSPESLENHRMVRHDGQTVYVHSCTPPADNFYWKD